MSAIAAGSYHTCAVTNAGRVKCWGYNEFGQLGDGTRTKRLTPVDVGGLTSGVMMVAAGDYHTCALTNAGGVKCWGQNNYSQLGDGTTTPHLTPVDVNRLTNGVMTIAAGTNHTCGITTMGGLRCWGWNGVGQLGNGTSIQPLTPVHVNGLTNGVRAVAVGSVHTCALTDAGSVKCWGWNDSWSVRQWQFRR